MGVAGRPWHLRFGVYEPGLEGLGVVNGRMEGSLETGDCRVPRDRSWGPRAQVQGLLVPLSRAAVWPSPQRLRRQPMRDCPGLEEGAGTPEGGKEGGK